MEQSRGVLFIGFLLIFLAPGQYAQSPCPQYFEYRTDETGFYGIVHVHPRRERVSSIHTSINFTIAARLTSNYLGRLEPVGGSEVALIQRFNSGIPIDYRLHFPVSSPVPRITSITVNDDVICIGPGDNQAQQYVTKVTLEHRLFLKNTVSGHVFTQPIHQTSPVSIFNSGDDRPSWTSGSQPFYEINNSQSDFGSPNRVQSSETGTYLLRPTINGVDLDTIFNVPNNIPAEEPVRRPVQTTSPPPPPPPPRPVITTQRPQQQFPPSVDVNACGLNGNMEQPVQELIYNGMSYNRGDWPWLVAIFKRKDIGLTYVCSGTLISNRHVVSAAHCMHRKTSLTSITDIVVKAGVYNILDWGDDDVTVTRILSSAIIHPSYNASTLANDILMLTFTRPIEFNTYIKAACLWSGNADLNLVVGALGVVTGWGVSEIGPAGRGEPRMVRMPIVSTTQCRSSKPDFHKLTSTKTLCAGDRNGSGPCLGDSGGGLYLFSDGRWKLRGVVSLSLISQAGDMTCNLDDYIVFTDAAQYDSWIRQNMQ